ncbi:MAG: mandelate racemase/muconate lactonizing enzyme family protein [Chloroflexota bacterium]|nr:mandelate racemase/muconate lactonizing enzyme family protein [Chloroflexota bacterium]
MKISSIEYVVLEELHPFVFIHTDEGITGIGECFRRQPLVTKTVVEELLTPALLGKDPVDTEARFRDMATAGQALEIGGAIWIGIAGLDIAMWDLKGKILNLPIYKLLGGKVRERVPVYASSMARNLTPLQEANRALSFVEKGYTGYKLHSAVPGKIDDSADQTIDTVTEVRKAVGDDIDILVDVNGAYSVHHAIEIGKQLEELGVFHFEEPRPHYDLPGLANVAEALDIPIASGEMIYSLYEYRELMMRGKVDIIQPDIVKTPGFTTLIKIANLAESLGIPITCHNTQPTISTVAHAHFVAATPGAPYAQEYNIESVSIRDEHPILSEPLQITNGFLKVPNGPGLGVALDMEMVHKLKT